jgi:hypothetical protein
MNLPNLRTPVLIATIVLCCLFHNALAAQETSTFHSTSSLVLVDVIAQNKKTGEPITQLKREDFQVFDQSRMVPLRSLDIGTNQIRPLALWFVVICPERNWKDQGSSFFKGKSDLLRPAFKSLNQNDMVAVAHWCDNGDVQIDLAPTRNREVPLLTLEQVLQTPAIDHPSPAPLGQLALQRMIQLIGDNARRTLPQPLPVVLFIHGDETDLPNKQAQQMLEGVLGTSAIAYGLNNGMILVHRSVLGSDEQFNLVHFMAARSGGQVISVKHDGYAEALTKIIDELHFRYDVGFAPATVDDKYHDLKVELTDAAKHQYDDIVLRYRAGYVPASRVGGFAGFNVPLLTDADAGAALRNAVKSPIAYADISFEVAAKMESDSPPTVHITVNVDSSDLAWNVLESGERRGEVMIVMAPLSEKGEPIEAIVKQFETKEPIQHEGSSKIAFSFSASVPANAPRIRFVIRDSETGRIGIQDFSREQLFPPTGGVAP